MFKYLIIWFLFTPFILANTIPISKSSEQLAIKKELSIPNHLPDQNKVTQNVVVSEGGSIDPINLLNKNSLLLNSEKELSQNKSSVHPRKGVNYTHIDDLQSNESVNQSSTTLNLNVTNKPVITSITPNDHSNLTNIPNVHNETKLQVIKKPTILSNEALEQMDKINHIDIEDAPDIKLPSMNAGSHPDMIMPIVITILVVPMFAVIGYMALKRGQEAWKNRHYKRMDFLLDGMYND